MPKLKSAVRLWEAKFERGITELSVLERFLQQRRFCAPSSSPVPMTALIVLHNEERKKQ